MSGACGSSIAGLVYRLIPARSADFGRWIAPLLIFTFVVPFFPSYPLPFFALILCALLTIPSVFELNAGIIIGCMRIVPALFESERLRSSLFRSFGSRNRSSRDKSNQQPKTFNNSDEFSRHPVPRGAVRVTKTFDAESYPGSDHESKVERMV